MGLHWICIQDTKSISEKRIKNPPCLIHPYLKIVSVFCFNPNVHLKSQISHKKASFFQPYPGRTYDPLSKSKCVNVSPNSRVFFTRHPPHQEQWDIKRSTNCLPSQDPFLFLSSSSPKKKNTIALSFSEKLARFMGYFAGASSVCRRWVLQIVELGRMFHESWQLFW